MKRSLKSPAKRAAAKVRDENLRADLLFEIGCEEIPAGMIPKAAQELKAILAKQLATHRLVDGPTVEDAIQVFGAPRRLAAIARGLRVKQEDVTREITGPPKSVAFDAAGEPTRAALSFAEKQGVPLSKLSIVSTPKGEYLAVKQTEYGRPATEILAKALPEAIREIGWPRSMYWTGADSPRFIRPIRWIVALLDDKVIPFSFAEVHSGRASDGHRFLGKRTIPAGRPRRVRSEAEEEFRPVPPRGTPPEDRGGNPFAHRAQRLAYARGPGSPRPRDLPE